MRRAWGIRLFKNRMFSIALSALLAVALTLTNFAGSYPTQVYADATPSTHANHDAQDNTSCSLHTGGGRL